MSHFSHQRSLATELTTLYLENKTQASVVINGLKLVFQRLNRIWSSHSINSTIKFRLYASCYLVCKYVSRLSGTGIVECLEIITGVVIHFTIDLG